MNTKNQAPSVACVVLNPFVNDSRVIKESGSLVKDGYAVSVICMHEGSLPVRECVNGVNVARIPLRSRSWYKVKPIQLLKYLEFVARAIPLARKADIVHCNDLNALPVGVIIKSFFNRSVKVVYDAHEYETEVQGLHGLWKKIVKIAERVLIKKADAVITVSDAIANKYMNDYGIDKPHLVLNCPHAEVVANQDVFRNRFNIPLDVDIFLYQGGLSYGRGIEIIIEAFSGNRFDNESVVVFMGNGPMVDLVRSAAESHPRIFQLDSVPHNELLSYTSSADFGILFYENTCLNHYYCSPNKLFEYLMAGLPIIASNLFEVEQIVKSENIGVVALETTVEGLAEAIQKASSLTSKVFSEDVSISRKKYCWAEQENVLLSLYRSLV